MGNKKRARDRDRTSASQADKYDLYQRSVQTPDHEIPIFHRFFKREYGRAPLLLREDFCGTFAVGCEWVKSKKERIAFGVDIDPEPLAWGREHNLARLKAKQQDRVHLLQQDVRQVDDRKVDIVAAQNFSFMIFKTRDALRAYFEAAFANLKREGLLVIDLMGGPESMEEDREDVTGYQGFKYVWDQARLDPITHDCRFHIHFRFKDGSELKRAFTYDWRFWMLPEVRELLIEAGFRRADVYWEGTDPKTGEGNDKYRRREHADNDPAWICYVVGVK